MVGRGLGSVVSVRCATPASSLCGDSDNSGLHISKGLRTDCSSDTSCHVTSGLGHGRRIAPNQNERQVILMLSWSRQTASPKEAEGKCIQKDCRECRLRIAMRWQNSGTDGLKYCVRLKRALCSEVYFETRRLVKTNQSKGDMVKRDVGEYSSCLFHIFGTVNRVLFNT